jgi:hypothetical protein
MKKFEMSIVDKHFLLFKSNWLSFAQQLFQRPKYSGLFVYIFFLSADDHTIWSSPGLPVALMFWRGEAG